VKPPLGPVRIAYGPDGEAFVFRAEPQLVRWRSSRPEDLSASAETAAEDNLPPGWPESWPRPQKVIPYTAPPRDRELDYPAFGGQATGRGLHASAEERADEEQRRRDDEIEREIRQIIAKALPPPRVIQTRDESGTLHTHVLARTEDPSFDHALTLASIPLDEELLDWPAVERDGEVEAALTAAAAQSERRRKQALLDERRKAAESKFAEAEAEALKRAAARRHHEVMTRYLTARFAAARRRRARKARQ
jgi:hypothetical protein